MLIPGFKNNDVVIRRSRGGFKIQMKWLGSQRLSYSDEKAAIVTKHGAAIEFRMITGCKI